MFRAILAVLLITLFSYPAQASTTTAPCLTPNDMHAELARQGLFLYSYGVTNDPFLVAVYGNGDSNFVVIAESPEISCILTDGLKLYETKRIGI